MIYGFRRELVGFLGDSCHNHFVLDNRGFDSVAIIPDRKSYLLGIAAYLSTIGVNFIIAAFNFLNGENGWIVLIAIGFAIISIPGAILLNLATIRIIK